MVNCESLKTLLAANNLVKAHEELKIIVASADLDDLRWDLCGPFALIPHDKEGLEFANKATDLIKGRFIKYCEESFGGMDTRDWEGFLKLFMHLNYKVDEDSPSKGGLTPRRSTNDLEWDLKPFYAKLIELMPLHGCDESDDGSPAISIANEYLGEAHPVAVQVFHFFSSTHG